MREFYIVTTESNRKDIQSVTSYDLGDFSHTRFWNTTLLPDDCLHSVRLWLMRGRKPDLLGGPLSILICSQRLLSIFQKWSSSDFQALPAPTYFADTNEPVDGFFALNPLRRIDCLDQDKSNITYMTIRGKDVPCVNSLVIRHDAVPQNTHLFRIPESASRIIISEELAQDIMAAVPVGIALIRAKSS